MQIVASVVHATLIMTMSENSWLNRLIGYILNEFQIIKQLSRIIKHKALMTSILAVITVNIQYRHKLLFIAVYKFT